MVISKKMVSENQEMFGAILPFLAAFHCGKKTAPDDRAHLFGWKERSSRLSLLGST
jgi:hypothetical protein